MATKAELETELEKLRQRNATLEARVEEDPKLKDAPERVKTSDEIRKLLEEHGIDLSKAQSLGEDVVEEFGRLQKDYPMTALLIAFSLGYVVGRAQG
ncbi:MULTISPECIES: hypothetical protein [unclassified Ruegeria]|uniref:hypothetical protein n=1 Tax=unclassified Ruegeria TaxID=2625375 RepID=UPI001488B490|nr:MULTISPECIES: hypothetical protein [unclassified Ruegeria]NOD78069.1 hypothetical protein [Ruegeria sp. HKCCD4332]NOD87653.1 hypothetical protein [Ruegeria sp. HKCCD4318]NOE15686.1 hypothetical protein [Ruegeria sp. HKCCD4318-2]NOG08622.1 hypothetical protein [Ruegeria sp. HKCCD4315]